MSHVWWWCLASMKCMTWLPCLYVSLVSYYWSIQTVWYSIKLEIVINQWKLSIIGKWPITENYYEHHVSLLWLKHHVNIKLWCDILTIDVGLEENFKLLMVGSELATEFFWYLIFGTIFNLLNFLAQVKIWT